MQPECAGPVSIFLNNAKQELCAGASCLGSLLKTKFQLTCLRCFRVSAFTILPASLMKWLHWAWELRRPGSG